ncbi:LamG domain-containing protein [Kaarinaea lacus]
MSRAKIIKNLTELHPQSSHGDNMMQRTECTKGFWRNTMNRPDPITIANHSSRVSQHLQWLLLSLLLLTLYGCGNSVSNGQDPSGNNTFTGAGSTLNLTADQSAFWSNVHQPIFRQYCKTCHEPMGSGVGEFAHRTDIVHAYDESNDVTSGRINRTDPASSLFVTKVASGHNCWVIVNNLPDCTQSAAQLTSAISNWVNADPAEVIADQSDSGTTAEIDIVSVLATPPDVAPVAEQIVLGVTPLADEANYNTYVYGPIISQHCQECHSEDANQQQRQTPYFADTNLTAAFNAVVDTRKIDINTPDNSRVYLRLLQDSHNCWTDCASNAATMLAAINAWKTAIISDAGYTAPQVDGDGVAPISQGLELGQGQIISGGDRYTRNLVALWEFKEGPGNTTVADTSGVSPPLDLVLEGVEGSTYDWVGGYGIEFKGGYARGTSTSASQKIYDLIAPRNEYTIEAWVVPANVSQEGPAVIASYSSGASNRNFTMGQTLYSYEFLNRNTNSGVPAAATANGSPTLITNPDDEDLQATQQHVVMTYDPTNGRRVYVNGQFTGDVDTVTGGSLGEWDDGYLFVLGAETNGINNRWQGKVRLVAIYNRALSQEQITQNFDAGVGQKFNLLFKVGHLTTQLPDESYVWFEVAEFDSSAYLFANPRFVVLGASPTPASFSAQIRGMRIGVNGVEAPVGQVFMNLDKTVSMSYPLGPNDPTYLPLIDEVQGTVDGASRMIPISATGTVIAQQNGPNSVPADQFYLTFAQLGDQTDVRTPAVSSGAIGYNYDAPVAGLADSSYITGVRLFEEINASMSEVTGVPMSNSTVRNIYLEIQQALPNSPAMEGFLASHQIGIAKMALGYCGELVDNTTLRDNFFPGFPFNDAVATAFDTPAEQDIIVDALYNNIVVDNVPSQPTRTETRDILFATSTGLLDQLAAGCAADTNCTPDSNRTKTIVKSMCVTVLSSAALTVQ